MKYSRIAALAVSVGAMSLAVATPAQAEPDTDAFLRSLSYAGIGGVDPATAVEVGQSVCPMLAEPGQRMADVAAQVADAIGRPLGPATMFTGVAITMFCPGVVAAVANGQSPVPLSLIGI
jgi:Protein of unknown function (DUF732)